MINKARLFYLVLLCAASLMLGCSMGSSAQGLKGQATPIIVPGAPITDDQGNIVQGHGGSILQVGKTFYWYGEDKHGEAAQDAHFQNVACYQSQDLMNWHFANNVLKEQNSGDLGPGRIVERPKVLYNDATKTYVMYLHIDDPKYAEAKVGVATALTPCGDYSYKGSFRPLGFQSRDIGLFKDDDGSGYLLTEDRVNGLRIDKLSADYLSVVTNVATLADREAPAIVKVNGVYFLLSSFLTGWNTNDNQYTTASSLAGPWSEFDYLAPKGTNTYDSQTTFVLPLHGSSGTAFLYVGDRWNQDHLGDSAQVWLPLTITLSVLQKSAKLDFSGPWQLNVVDGTWSKQVTQNHAKGR